MMTYCIGFFVDFVSESRPLKSADLIGKNIEAVSTAAAAVLSTIIAEENLYGKVVSDSYGEHTKGSRPSTKGKHEKGQARKGTDRGGEKGDSSRRHPNKKPGGWKGPWPPKK